MLPETECVDFPVSLKMKLFRFPVIHSSCSKESSHRTIAPVFVHMPARHYRYSIDLTLLTALRGRPCMKCVTLLFLIVFIPLPFSQSVINLGHPHPYLKRRSPIIITLRDMTKERCRKCLIDVHKL